MVGELAGALAYLTELPARGVGADMAGALAYLTELPARGVGADMRWGEPADCWSTWRLTPCLVATASLLDPAR